MCDQGFAMEKLILKIWTVVEFSSIYNHVEYIVEMV